MKIAELITGTYIKTNQKCITSFFLLFVTMGNTLHNLITYVLYCINTTIDLNIGYSQVKMSV